MFAFYPEKDVQVHLPDGRIVVLTSHEYALIENAAEESRGPLEALVDSEHYEQERDKKDHERRYKIVRMAVAGEFSAIARQLKIWGIEACR